MAIVAYHNIYIHNNLTCSSLYACCVFGFACFVALDTELSRNTRTAIMHVVHPE